VDADKAKVVFSEWQVKQHPEMGNEELVRAWMSQVEVLTL
jgi:hypothetical protein